MSKALLGGLGRGRAWQLVLFTLISRLQGLELTLHTALSSEQELGSTVQYGCQSWAQCRAQRPITPTPSCPGRHGVDATPILSVTPLCRVVVRLMSREWLVTLVGRDVPVEAAMTG